MAKKKDAVRKYLLDTSIQIERVKFSDFDKKISQLASSGSLYTSNFVYYEYKVGIILSFIEFYYVVKAYNDVSIALNKWSDRIGRDPKYQLINQGILAKVNKSINFSDVQDYLDKLEATILYLIHYFDRNIKGRCGNFAGDEIVKFDLYNSSSYQAFKELYESRKKMPLVAFWQQNHESLVKLVNCRLLEDKYKKFHSYLSQIKDDISKADSYWPNKMTGDAVIAADSPRDYVIITLDNIFEHLATALNKEFSILKKS